MEPEPLTQTTQVLQGSHHPGRTPRLPRRASVTHVPETEPPSYRQLEEETGQSCGLCTRKIKLHDGELAPLYRLLATHRTELIPCALEEAHRLLLPYLTVLLSYDNSSQQALIRLSQRLTRKQRQHTEAEEQRRLTLLAQADRRRSSRETSQSPGLRRSLQQYTHKEGPDGSAALHLATMQSQEPRDRSAREARYRASKARLGQRRVQTHS